jgi:hypothetical protein
MYRTLLTLTLAGTLALTAGAVAAEVIRRIDPETGKMLIFVPQPSPSLPPSAYGVRQIETVYDAYGNLITRFKMVYPGQTAPAPGPAAAPQPPPAP